MKDSIDSYVVHGATAAVHPARKGTKAAAHYAVTIEPAEQKTIRLRLQHSDTTNDAFSDFDKILVQRQREADEFYATIIPQDLSTDTQNVMRQSFAGMLWSKQFYHYVVRDWLQGDRGNPPLPQNERRAEIATGRTSTTRTSSPCRISGSIRGMRMGPGISLRSARACGSRFREGSGALQGESAEDAAASGAAEMQRIVDKWKQAG